MKHLYASAPVGPKCRCGHNARWHGIELDCLAVLCDCRTYVAVREKEPTLAAHLVGSQLEGAA